jgi:RND family efflux transporter MFP subunit
MSRREIRRRARPRSALVAWCAWLLLAPGSAFGAGDELECLLRPRATARLALPGEGIVERITVDRGDLVKEGQVLVELESSIERASVEIARARAEMDAEVERARVRLEFANRALTRSKELKETSVISDSAMDESESSLDLAKAGLRAAEQELRLAGLELTRSQALLDLRTIRSPMNGVVVDRLMSPGEYADSQEILEIADIDPLYVEVIAPVSLLGRIEVGSEARIQTEQAIGGEHRARVTVVDRVIDAASGTFGVRLELPNPGYAIPAGLSCRVEFASASGPAKSGVKPAAAERDAQRAALPAKAPAPD